MPVDLVISGPSRVTITKGSRIGRYQVSRLLGSGGMGEVYLADDRDLLRPVAVKLLAPSLRQDSEREESLAREARAASALNHPGILTIYEIGRFEDTTFIATEYVEGITVRQRLQAGALPLQEAVDIAWQVASALEAAHAGHIVHGDIKPENIMVRPDGYVKLLDFGIARLLAPPSADPEGETRPLPPVGLRPGLVMGTTAYICPELLREQPIDGRADIWSLGVVLHEMCRGRPPFVGSTPSEIVVAILRQPLPLWETEDGGPMSVVGHIVETCLEKDPDSRYQTAADLRAALARLKLSLHAEARAFADADSESTAASTPTAVLPRTEAARARALPSPLAPFIGRRAEIAAAVEMLARPETRLVTLTGPGGVGKTRLLLEVARRLSDATDLLWVPLASVRDPALVPWAVASALGIKESATATLTDAIKEALSRGPAILLCDNFEQVSEAAPLLPELLAACRSLKVLVTSRERLKVSGELELPVPPMELPDLHALPAPETLAGLPSVALFCDRARAVRPDFQLTAEEAPAVAEICSRLDGLPLAIELCAARVKALAPRALLSRMGSRLALLSGGARDLPARQRTMREAIAWGHNLLPDAEKELFARLSVFAGGFTLDAAEALWGGDSARLDLLEGVTLLCDKSLIRPLREAGARFGMLETLREYGLECLRESGAETAARERHARYFLNWSEEAEPALTGEGQAEWLGRLEADHENLRAALLYLLDQEDAEPGIRMAGSLSRFFYLHGHYSEGRHFLDRALARSAGARTAGRAKVLLGAGRLAFLQCDYDRAAALLHESIALSQELLDRRGLASGLQSLGSVARERGQYVEALAYHEASLAIWRELSDERGIALSQNYIGFAAWLEGDLARAIPVCEATLATFQRLGDHEGSAWSLLSLAAAAYHGGDPSRAEKLSRESLELSRRIGYKEGLAWSHDILGRIDLARGKAEDSLAHLEKSFRLHRELGDRWRMASVLEAMARAACARGDARWAARLLGAAEALRARVRTPLPPAERADYEAGLAAVRAALTGAEMEELIVVGRAGRLDEAIDPRRS